MERLNSAVNDRLGCANAYLRLVLVTVGDQVFFADDLELTVFRSDDGYAAYEIKEGDEYIALR